VEVASHVAQLQALVAELRRQTDAAVRGLYAVRARTSKVLMATEAFAALSARVTNLNHSLWTPTMADRLNGDAVARWDFEEEVRQLSHELEELRQRYETELLLTTPVPPPPKKPWWRVFS